MGKSPIAWYGGKSGLAPTLLKLIPEHTTYVEVFGGSGALLFAKSPSPIEVYNDLDEGLVNFWRVVRDTQSYEQLATLLVLTPYARTEHRECEQTWRETDDPIERARRWFVVAKMSFSADVRRTNSGWTFNVTLSRRGMAAAVSKYLSAIELLPEIHRRLQRVQVDCKDWHEIIATYDTPDTLFYLDPPYVLETRVGGKAYHHEMVDDDHQELVASLLTIKGKAILSGYQHELYRPLEEAGWVRSDYDVASSAAGRTRVTGLLGEGSGQRRTESVWVSPSAQTTQLPLFANII